MFGFDWSLTGIVVALGGTLGVVAEPAGALDEAEKAIIHRAKNGDARAFEQLVRKYQRGIYALAMRMMLNHQDADDVVQDAFIKAWSNLQTYSEEFKFYTWLYRIAMNTALTMLKQRHRSHSSLDTLMENEHFQPAIDEDLEVDVEYSEMEHRVRNALDQIHPDLRSVFILRTWGDLSYQEIADNLGIQIGTVMSRLNRARGRLQRLLKDDPAVIRRERGADEAENDAI